MPHYFFHLRCGSAVETDEDGVEFGSLEGAIAEAQHAACEILAEENSGAHNGGRCFEITDQSGQVVAEVPFADLHRSFGVRRPGKFQLRNA